VKKIRSHITHINAREQRCWIFDIPFIR